MQPIKTPFTRLLEIQTPIVAAAMAGASSGALAAQVTLAGGFGFFAAGYGSVEAFQDEIKTARTLLQVDEESTLAIGVSFLAWQLDKRQYNALECIPIALENRVKAIWLSFGEDLGKWIKYIREHDPRAGTKDAVKIFVQISTVEHALMAINDWKVDVIIVQGNEAGGHGISASLPLMTLLPLIMSAISSEHSPPPIVAAGGVATGAQIASLLTLGAAGVALGTRFLLSPESSYSDVQRRALISADSSSSVRTMAFDHVRDTLGWPEGVDGRALRNMTVDDYENGEDINLLKQKYTESIRRGDTDRTLVWAGAGVGLMHQIKPARDILVELHEECLQRLNDVNILVRSDA
ncbi:2-nitropropane dioxygenase [Phlegmacium glaucopus]|nr:2-nitropropane dioxygenase [Phlegmacium glaucopus]